MAAEREKMVSAVFRNHADAQQAFDWLLRRGYTSQEVNVLTSDTTRANYFPPESREEHLSAGSHAAEGMGIGGAVGTAVGATVAAVLAIGTSLFIPPLGLIVAGPLAAALAGGGAGAVAGGLIGALVGLGIPESNAKAYEQALREGGVIIGVTPRSNEEAAQIKKYLENHNGENVCYC
jgi:hypothetical protein